MSVDRELLKKFRKNSLSQIIYVLMTSLVAYWALLFLAFKLSSESYWWVIALALPTHWMHARIFILMHDCGHYSFFKQRWLNTLCGHLSGFFYYTPFLMWRELHNKHHTNQGNLDKRGQSLDVWTMTKTEYDLAHFTTRLMYQAYRHPLTVLFVSPFVLFLLIFRLPFEKFSTKALVNILLLDVIIFMALFYYPEAAISYFLIQLPSLLISLSMASFLFYVQHQFEHTLWLRKESFQNEMISLKGSSFFKMSAFFDWCYGYIGYHHVHHYDTKIPMYHLKLANNELNSNSNVISLKSAIKSLKLRLWDESQNKLI